MKNIIKKTAVSFLFLGGCFGFACLASSMVLFVYFWVFLADLGMRGIK